MVCISLVLVSLVISVVLVIWVILMIMLISVFLLVCIVIDLKKNKSLAKPSTKHKLESNKNTKIKKLTPIKCIKRSITTLEPVQSAPLFHLLALFIHPY